MPRKLWTEERVNELKALSMSHTQKKCAELMGLNLRQIKSAQSRFGIYFCNSKLSRNNEIIELVASGHELKDVADKFGISRQRVSQICLV